MKKIWHYFFPVENSGMTEIRNIFKDYTKDIEKFDDGLRNNKYGIIFIYDYYNNVNLIKNFFREIMKDNKLFNDIKEIFKTKLIDFNNKQKVNKNNKYFNENINNNTIYFIKMINNNKYLNIKCEININQFKSEVEKIINNINEELNDEHPKNNIINNNSLSSNHLIDEKSNLTSFLSKKIKNDEFENNINTINSSILNIEKKNLEKNVNINKELNQNIKEIKKGSNLNNNKNLNDFENRKTIENIKSNNDIFLNEEDSNYSFPDFKTKNEDSYYKKSIKKISEEPKESDYTTKIFFILNNNLIVERNFNKDDKIQLMFDFLETKGFNQNIILSQTFPEKYYENKEKTFYDEGLYPDGYIKIII